MNEIERKITDQNNDTYITTPEFNNLKAAVFTARLAQENLVIKTDFDTKLQDISKRITSNKTKHTVVENELNKLQQFDSGCFKGKIHFEENDT